MITNTARKLLSVSNYTLRFGFCLNKAHLDPYKHTTMSHSPHNMFVDLYDFGEYPEVIIPSSIAARTYQPIVVSTTVDILNTRFVSNFIICRASISLSKISIITSKNHGPDSSRKISTLMFHKKKSLLQF